MALPTPAEIFSEPNRYYQVIDLARLFNVPCHTIESCLEPDPRALAVLNAISLGKLDPSGITEDSLAVFQAANPD